MRMIKQMGTKCKQLLNSIKAIWDSLILVLQLFCKFVKLFKSFVKKREFVNTDKSLIGEIVDFFFFF